jgi:hypothetical protein
VQKIKDEYSRKETFSTVSSVGLKILLEKVKPKFPESDIAKQTQLDLFIKQFENYNYTITSDSKGNPQILILKPDGSRLEDEHAHAIPFEKLVSETAERFFDIPKSQERSSGAGKPAGGGEGKKYSFTKPQSEAEYSKMLQQIADDTSLSFAEKVEAKTALRDLFRGEGVTA